MLVVGWLMQAGSGLSAPPHVLSDGIVVFEAEDFSANLSPRSGHEWQITNAVAGFSGIGYVEGIPDNNAVFTNWAVDSPELQYTVVFATAATHYVWVRGYGATNTADSVHWGLDGVTNAPSGINWTTYHAWVWTNRVTATSIATLSVTSAGAHTFNLWIREDGALIDRVVLTVHTNFEPRIGNAWHIPSNLEPGIPSMRIPVRAIFSNTAVTIINGNQFQGEGNAANQLRVGSAIFYRNATNDTWTELPMFFHSQSGNNKYFSNAIPPNVFRAGDRVQYYLRIPYSDRLPTYLYTSGGVSRATELESVAQANPFSYTVLETPQPGYPSPEDWRDMNIYQIFTDRFYDGDPSNNPADPWDVFNPTASLGLHGGDLKGVEKKLDYVKALGATAIWINPLPLTAGTNVAYHGYTAHDFYQLAPHWGSVADLTSMVAAAHARGLRVILDVVCNHQGNRIDSGDAGWPTYNSSGYTLRWTVPGMTYPTPFDSLSHFHNFGHIGNYVDPEQLLGELRGLDDLRTETEHVRTNMVSIYRYWMDLADFDGFRLDAVKHVEVGFWQYWNPEIRAYANAKGKTNFFTFGEIIAGDYDCGRYTGTKSGAAFANDSELDYPLYFLINSVFANASGNTKQIEDRYNNIAANYDPAAHYRLVTFLDNHDRPRFMSTGNANNNFNRLAVALTFLYTARGIPCLYYGTEQSFNGAASPNNREDLFDGLFEQGPSLGDNFDMTHESFLHIAKLNNFRRLYPSLCRGTHVNLWNNPTGPGLLAYARRLDNEEVLVVLNTAGSSQTLTNRPTRYAPGTPLVNLFNTNEMITITSATNTPPVSVPGTSYKMFIAAALWKPLDPMVIHQVPGHAATNVSPTAPVVLRFDQPMDTGSVQQAFSVQPPVGGTFAWNGARDELTFAPGGPGFAALATNTIRLTTQARGSGSGNFLYAPFETFFVTAALTDNVPPTITLDQPAPGSVLSSQIVVSGTAADDRALQKVEFRLDHNEWVDVTGTSSWTCALDTMNFLNGSHVLYARATDASGNVSSNASVGVRFFNVPGGYVQRLSAGNPNDVTNCDASVWVKDRPHRFGSFGYAGGFAGVVANVISGVCVEAQALYQHERYSSPATSFDYLFDCPAGLYEITLLEAETSVTGANGRVFNLYLEDQPALANFDLYAAAGGMNIPVSLVFTSGVADAQLAMHFVPQTGSARASGIQVRKIGDLDSDADGLPDWWMLGWFDHPTGQEADCSRAEDDADGDGMDNLAEFVAGTDPLDPGSLLRIEDIRAEDVDGSVKASIRFFSVSGRTYLLNFADGPRPPDWHALPPEIPGTNGWISVADTNQAPVRLYRLGVHKP